MKYASLIAVTIATLTTSAFAESDCTIKARNTALTKHQRTTYLSNISLSECVIAAETELGKKDVFKTKAGIFDINLVRYTYHSVDARTGESKVIEGEITSNRNRRSESDDELSDETENTTDTHTSYRPRRDRCGGEEQ